jgi:hypothetical protein
MVNSSTAVNKKVQSAVANYGNVTGGKLRLDVSAFLTAVAWQRVYVTPSARID